MSQYKDYCDLCHTVTVIFISCCGHGTTAVGPDLAGPNCDEPPIKLKVRVRVGRPKTRPRRRRQGRERAALTAGGHHRRRSQAASQPRVTRSADVCRVPRCSALYAIVALRARTRRAGIGGRQCRAASHRLATSRAAAAGPPTTAAPRSPGKPSLPKQLLFCASRRPP
jgi:hypothetical protein